MKLYIEMTRAEKLRYRTETVARWIKKGMMFAIVNLPRKVRDGRQWWWTNDWCWKDSKEDLKPIDLDLLYDLLGVKMNESMPYLAHNLKNAGINIIDLDNVIVFNVK